MEALPAKYNTLAASVEDIVQHCLATRFITSMPGMAGASQNGALTMAVQPASSGMNINPSASMGPNDFSVAGYNMGDTGGLIEDIANPALFTTQAADIAAEDGAVDIATLMHPYGETQLGDAALGLGNSGTYPHLDVLNPVSTFESYFEPTQTDGPFANEGTFDAFNMNGNAAADQQTFAFDEPEFDLFVHEDNTF